MKLVAKVDSEKEFSAKPTFGKSAKEGVKLDFGELKKKQPRIVAKKLKKGRKGY